MDNLTKFVNRLQNIGIKIDLISNYPWVYLNTVNGVKVKELQSSEHGWVIGFYSIKENDKFDFYYNLSETFKLIRKYNRKWFKKRILHKIIVKRHE